MSSINPHYTFKYSQPTEHRFSHDSVFLARKVYEELKTPKGVLDLCSGCGIVGLDYLFHQRENHRPMPEFVDFLEIQEVYKLHFQKNLETFGASLPMTRFLNVNYDSLLSEDFKDKYDLVLSNPPYFIEGQGTLSTNEFKNRCRFFLDSTMENLMACIENVLAPDGSAFVLSRLDLRPFTNLSVFEVADIRGTPLFHLRKIH